VTPSALLSLLFAEGVNRQVRGEGDVDEKVNPFPAVSFGSKSDPYISRTV